ncbi:aminotransferase class I/II-fold pyridoxal phosphate-dependent enzyme [Enorma burkinafasonensis]|uniref:aminotransferase class I/II-fold pyridoxal phosphate-dependent enzyme n=1 Tax=Enorma burkinafasonensis TaxID=2590867 RepID=UPI0026ECFCC0|nr:aminotransferase class I/II-fold pyridoxal phosphate-dependent enzyme [Enorma burkinafasonensis]MCI7730125.1 aminotransferase class I/II-fold pyridoxal phosphate-dependent enzyme [Enorma burkinafasonensis]
MATIYQQMSASELDDAIAGLEAEVERTRSLGLALDMARGKPSPAQVDISRPMLDLISSGADLTDEGVDCSNYGCFEGIPSARRLAGEFIGVPPEQTIVLGSSSLNIMQSILIHYWEKGVPGYTPWSKVDHVKFLCPSPGYDRHFGITADLGIENIPVRMTETGPDMDEVERLCVADDSIKGMFCVPKYSNPTGITYSDETVRRLASMKAAPDFRIVWDNAYAVHDLTDEGDVLANIFDLAREAGNADRVLGVASTSKITFPGAGIAFFGSSAANVEAVSRTLKAGLISANKLNQLMHVRFLPDMDAVRAHMRRHAEFLRPRFEAVERKLEEGLAGTGCATWSHPRGGYFVSFEGPEGSAKRVAALCAELGVKLTPAGATWPYGADPHDSNIRIAPSYPTVAELEAALDVLVLAVKLVSAQLAREERR